MKIKHGYCIFCYGNNRGLVPPPKKGLDPPQKIIKIVKKSYLEDIDGSLLGSWEDGVMLDIIRGHTSQLKKNLCGRVLCATQGEGWLESS